MRLATLVATAVISLAGACPAGAAASYSFDPVSDGGTHLAGTGTVAGPFTDYWNFSLGGAGVGDFAIGNLRIDLTPSLNLFNASDLTVSLWSGSAVGGHVQAGAREVAGPAPAIIQAVMPSGDYFLKVDGIGDGAATGQGVYGLSYGVVMPLPEPDSLGTFIAGIGLLGLCLKRLQRQTPAG